MWACIQFPIVDLRWHNYISTIYDDIPLANDSKGLNFLRGIGRVLSGPQIRNSVKGSHPSKSIRRNPSSPLYWTSDDELLWVEVSPRNLSFDPTAFQLSLKSIKSPRVSFRYLILNKNRTTTSRLIVGFTGALDVSTLETGNEIIDILKQFKSLDVNLRIYNASPTVKLMQLGNAFADLYAESTSSRHSDIRFSSVYSGKPLIVILFDEDEASFLNNRRKGRHHTLSQIFEHKAVELENQVVHVWSASYSTVNSYRLKQECRAISRNHAHAEFLWTSVRILIRGGMIASRAIQRIGDDLVASCGYVLRRTRYNTDIVRIRNQTEAIEGRPTRAEIEQVSDNLSSQCSELLHEAIKPSSHNLRDRVFVSYKHGIDGQVVDAIRRRLTGIEKTNLIHYLSCKDSGQAPAIALHNNELVYFDDRLILPGTNFEERIKQELNRTKVAILVLSFDFTLSTYINDIELPAIIDAFKRQELTIVPVYARTVRNFELPRNLRDLSLACVLPNDPDHVLRHEPTQCDEDEFLANLHEYVAGRLGIELG
jgi:hypothetical protein